MFACPFKKDISHGLQNEVVELTTLLHALSLINAHFLVNILDIRYYSNETIPRLTTILDFMHI